jgi:hypothetical protein
MTVIFLHQLRDHLKSFRFQLSLLMLLILFVGNGVIYTWKQAQLIDYNLNFGAENEKRYEGNKTIDQVVGQYYRILSTRLDTEFITEGGANWFDDTFWVSAASGNGDIGHWRMRSNNHWMRRYELVDWTLVVRIVLSFLCIVLAYDAVSREIESGTLRLALANALPRGHFLAGKFLAHLTILLVATALGILISLLILSLNGAVQLNGEIALSCLLFLLGTTLYLTLFLFLAMGFSALLRNSAASLVVLVLVWAVLVVIVPQTSYLVSSQAVEPVGRWWEKADEIVEETKRLLERDGIGQRGRELGKVDNYAMEKRYVQRIQEAEKEQVQFARSIRDQSIRQYKVARSVNLLSPGFAFQYATEAFLATGLGRYEDLFRQVYNYRQTLRDFIRARDAADSASPHVLFLPGYLSDTPLDHKHIPRFKQKPISLAESIAGGVGPIAILTLEALLAFFFALWAFNRAEIAGE